MDPFALLDEAVRVAESRGYPAAGWFLCRDEEGYSAWVYGSDGETETPLWSVSNLHETLGAAASEALAHAQDLPHLGFALGGGGQGAGVA